MDNLARFTSVPPLTPTPSPESASSRGAPRGGVEGSKTPRWLHWCAVFVVCAAFVLLVLGSLVTTLKAGMADRYWPTEPWFLLRDQKAIIAEAERQGYAPLLFVLEHSHRAAGWLVGACAIGLCAGAWLSSTRWSVRWLCFAALLAVVLQGVLGGMRVRLNDWAGTDLATFHGCLAQLVFSLLVGVALATSDSWARGPVLALPGKLGNLALGVAALVYLQVVFGAILRHSHPPFAQRIHFLLAFGVFGAVFSLLSSLKQAGQEDRRFRWAAWCLMAFLTLQILLGVEAWMMRFGRYTLPELLPFSLGTTVVRTLHFVFGTLLFSTTVVLAALARQAAPRNDQSPRSRERVLEGVA